MSLNFTETKTPSGTLTAIKTLLLKQKFIFESSRYSKGYFRNQDVGKEDNLKINFSFNMT